MWNSRTKSRYKPASIRENEQTVMPLLPGRDQLWRLIEKSGPIWYVRNYPIVRWVRVRSGRCERTTAGGFVSMVSWWYREQGLTGCE